jgi:hypothetical protein
LGELEVLLTATPGLGATADLITVSIRARDPQGAVGDVSFAVDWGDPPMQFPASSASCARLRSPVSVDETRTFLHGYRNAATYSIRARVESGSCTTAESEVAEAAVTVRIRAGARPSNGPVPPAPRLDDRRGASDTPGEPRFLVSASDDDGYVTKVSVDWGDGTTEVAGVRSLAGCEDDSVRWPTEGLGGDLRHQHAPGRYRVTVSAVSAGCDGRDEQRGTASFDISA